MVRMQGILDHEGSNGGFTSEGTYTGKSELGISLTSNQGGLSGITQDNIYIETRGYISGVAGQSFLLGASGTVFDIRTFNGDVTLNSSNNITGRAFSDISWTASNDITLQSFVGDVILDADAGDISGVARYPIGLRSETSYIDIESADKLYLNAEDDLFINSDADLRVNADKIVWVSDTVFSISAGSNIQAESSNGFISYTTNNDNDITLAAASEGGTGDLNLYAGNNIDIAGSSISGVASTFVGMTANEFLHLQTVGAGADILLNSDDAIVLSADGGMILASRGVSLSLASVAGLSGVSSNSFVGLRSSAGLMHLESLGASANLIINSDNNMTVWADGTSRFGGKNSYLNCSSTTTTLVGNSSSLTIGGIGNTISLTGLATTISVGAVTWNSSAVTASITGNASFNSGGLGANIFKINYPEIRLLAGSTGSNGILLRSDKNVILQTTGASDNIILRPHSGKTIFTKIAEDNRAPINVSGIPTVIGNFANNETGGDLGYTSASSNVDRGQGRLWLSTGSGIAPVSIGSGVGAAIADATTTVTATGTSAHTAIQFGSNTVVDRQFQKPNDTTFTPTQNGLYKITFSVSYQNTTGTIATVRTWIVINGSRTQAIDCVVLASGFGTVGNASLTILKYLNAGDTVQVGASKILGAGATVATGSNLSMITIEQIRPYI